MAKTKIVWNDYLATAYAEGEIKGNQKEILEAWSYLIKTKLAWKLQKWFGKAADTLIQQKIVDKEGNISWNTLEEIEKE